MRHRAPTLSIVLVLVFGLTGAPALSASVDEEQLAYELGFREKCGLTTDADFVRTVMADRANYGPYDVALTAAEQDELAHRVDIERNIGPLKRFVETLPNFGGLWIDQHAGGVINVAFTTGGSEYADAIATLLPKTAVYRLVEVEYSQAYLEQLANEIWGDRDELESLGISIGHLYADISTGRVAVGVRDATADDEDLLQSRYGSAVTSEPSDPTPSACTGRNSCYGPPLRAGIAGDNGCSMAFQVHKGTSGVNILTAGHCVGALFEDWDHASNSNWPIGEVKQSGWPQSNYSDVARLNLVSSDLESDWVYRTSTGAHSHVHDQVPGEEEVEGMTVCLSGRKGGDGFRCGTLTHIGTMNYGGGIVFYEMRFGDYAIKNGDSGGAIHSAYRSIGVSAQGVQSGCTIGFDGQGNCLGEGVFSSLALAMGEVGFSQACSDVWPC
jgi:hypothetical protein